MLKEPKIAFLPVLDGVRAIAVILVLIGHFPTIHAESYGNQISFFIGKSQLAYFGVDLFFVLSGFLITRILLAEKNGGGISFRRFYYRRSLRIFPLFYLCLVICAIFYYGPEIPWVATYLANYYFMLDSGASPLRHTWSLAVEEQFYLFWPFVVSAIRIDRMETVIGRVFPCLAIVAAIGVTLTFEEAHSNQIIYASTPTRMLSLSLGALIAVKEVKRYTWKRSSILATIVCGGILAYGAGVLSIVDLEVPMERLWKMVGFSLLSFGFILFVLYGAKSTGRLSKVLNSQPLQFLGKISYGVYMYHVIFLYAVGASHMQRDSTWSIPAALGFIGCVIVIATFSFFYLEKPILLLKNRPPTLLKKSISK